MRPTASRTVTGPGARLPGPSVIAMGVAILTVAVVWPTLPATTGAALVAVGATGAVVNQLRSSTWLQFGVIAHLTVYVSLYLLFVGAVAHAAMSGPQDGLTFPQGLDLGFSAGLMTLAVRSGVAAIRWGGDAQTR